jgi:DNA-binding MarR family transcriptional regulator
MKAGANGGGGLRASVGFTLSQLGFETSRRFAELVGKIGLEPRHFAVLRAAGEHAGQSQQAIAERLHIPPSTMVALVDHLESWKMLERRRDPTDRRTYIVHVTPAGMTLLKKALDLAMQQEKRVCAGLSDDERVTLLTLLGRVAANLDIDAESLPDAGSGRRPESALG